MSSSSSSAAHKGIAVLLRLEFRQEPGTDFGANKHGAQNLPIGLAPVFLFGVLVTYALPLPDGMYNAQDTGTSLVAAGD
ncbi:hypothetical protein [Rhodococcus sp. WAY2]|uniref:hypothetical protein n=1 Tax=Rhodococcus sp. WAY2 TaxID=2663121 RepID=UPI00131FBF6B|nr:hypothetical protein [Rhodococcus sp. WAY2]QHE72569.1 hypothetical protein GFS60_06212 [Rhodococcus sp. WAY2]